MKIKKLIIRAVMLTLATLLLFTSVSCGQKDGEDQNDGSGHLTEVKKQGFAESGNFIYCEWPPKVYRYNMKTEKIFRACMDVECDGKCPLDYSIGIFFAGTDGENVYILAAQPSKVVHLVSQNIVSGEVKIVRTFDSMETEGSHTTFVDGEKWYYKRKILKENGDPASSEDYESHICRMSLDGTNEEVIAKVDKLETLAMVGGGKIVTFLDNVLYTIDVESKERKLLLDLGAEDFQAPFTTMQYLDGKIYLVEWSVFQETSQITGNTYNLSFLLYVDVNTGEWGKVVERPVLNFCLTESGIYYVPLANRYSGNVEGARVCNFEESIYRCDLNGENTEKVYTNAMIDFSFKFTVIDNTLYGWLCDYNEDSLSYDKTFFGGIEFETGRIIRTEKDE